MSREVVHFQVERTLKDGRIYALQYNVSEVEIETSSLGRKEFLGRTVQWLREVTKIAADAEENKVS